MLGAYEDSRRLVNIGIAVGMMVAVIGGFLYWKFSDKEPSFEGRSAGSWLRDYQFGSEEAVQKADKALRALGGDALPALRESVTKEYQLPVSAGPGQGRSRDFGYVVRAEELIRFLESGRPQPSKL